MTFVYNLLVCALLALTFGFQEFIPAIAFAQYARVLLPPVFFLSASLSVTFPVMLVLAFFTGLAWDARHLPYRPEKVPALEATELVAENHVEKNVNITAMPVGYSIILFGMIGALMQGIRPLFRRGRWELPVLMVGVGTFAWLLTEYLLLSFVRGSFAFQPGMWTKLVTNTLLAMLVSPLLLFLLHTLARLVHHEVRNEGLAYRYNGR
ncbi:hypothetical protein DES53_102403 [Roseimicrobium gellanilyticum]|uniref:Uncharacterized protein n=1 Tax=Roseimicrobium gellanilyticum TaxID=748857 RepID=A0A366HSE5_9BACT|nr:hypothetical protein [Roseimicrobium gellanilyticum]RBP46018.1 hypothetical protein DES53_102403 [Roseimicrobium gellanilyticum]